MAWDLKILRLGVETTHHFVWANLHDACAASALPVDAASWASWAS
jgi:hypothetical protein